MWPPAAAAATATAATAGKAKPRWAYLPGFSVIGGRWAALGALGGAGGRWWALDPEHVFGGEGAPDGFDQVGVVHADQVSAEKGFVIHCLYR